jgi:hypothetical protein
MEQTLGEKINGAKMLFISTPPIASVFRRIYSIGNTPA